MAGRPRLTDIEVDPIELDHLCMGSIEWGYLWQGPQEVMSFLAQSGSRVLYVENTGIRRPRASDVGRIWSRVASWSRHPRGRVASTGSGITVISPLAVPLPWSDVARRFNQRFVVRAIRDRATDLGIIHPVVWTFVPNPLSLDVMRAFRADRSLAVYYCMQDFEHVTDNVMALRRAEAELIAEVDLIVTGARGLQLRFQSLHQNVIQAPVTVGERFFGAPLPEPSDLASIPRPRIGYVGGLHRHLDVELLAAVASACPDLSFVVIGPVYDARTPLPDLPQVHHLGRRPHMALPAYVDAFDVCLIPYRLSAFTETVWPTKLHEYLARGRAVVSTPIPEVVALGYPDVAVRTANGPRETIAAIRAALRDPAEAASVRVHLADRHRTSVVLTEVSRAVASAIRSSRR